MCVRGTLEGAGGHRGTGERVQGCGDLYAFARELYEGFFYRDGLFYEGTGLNGHSAVLVSEPATGKVVQRIDLPGEYFGEGIVDWGANLYEWTWQSHIGFIYDRFSLRSVGRFRYEGEGWG